MSEYQRVPVKAMRIIANNSDNRNAIEGGIPDWIQAAIEDELIAYNDNPGYERWEVETEDGTARIVRLGDWILKLGYRKFDVMPNEEFLETYQKCITITSEEP